MRSRTVASLVLYSSAMLATWATPSMSAVSVVAVICVSAHSSPADCPWGQSKPPAVAGDVASPLSERAHNRAPAHSAVMRPDLSRALRVILLARHRPPDRFGASEQFIAARAARCLLAEDRAAARVLRGRALGPAH